MNLKERIKEILEEFRTKNYHCGFKEGSTKFCKCPENIIQATTDILKEFDESLPRPIDRPLTLTKETNYNQGYNQAIKDTKERSR